MTWRTLTPLARRLRRRPSTNTQGAMMRLYSKTGATVIDDPQFGHFEAEPDGSFFLPNELSDRLHAHHVDGKPAWETEAERVERINAEELEKFRDPATLLAAVQALAAGQANLAAVLTTQAQTQKSTPEPTPEPAQVQKQAPEPDVTPQDPAPEQAEKPAPRRSRHTTTKA